VIAYGLDSSVVVRILTGEPESLATVARNELLQEFKKGTRFFVTDLVVSEVYFALQRHYGVPKDEVRAKLRTFLRSGMVIPMGHAPSALDDLVANPGKLGLVDRMIYREYTGNNYPLLTFEKAAKRLPLARVLCDG